MLQSVAKKTIANVSHAEARVGLMRAVVGAVENGVRTEVPTLARRGVNEAQAITRTSMIKDLVVINSDLRRLAFRAEVEQTVWRNERPVARVNVLAKGTFNGLTDALDRVQMMVRGLLRFDK